MRPLTKAATAEFIAILLAVALPSGISLLGFYVAPGWDPILRGPVFATAKTFQFLLPLVFVALVLPQVAGNEQTGTQRECKLRWYRPTTRGGFLAKGYIAGILFGIAVAILIWELYHLWFGRTAQFGEAKLQIRSILAAYKLNNSPAYVVLALFYSLVHSGLEEYYWRWFVFGGLRRLTGLAVAAILSGLAFSLHHFVVLGYYFGWCSLAQVVFTAGVAAGGTIWALIYEHYGRLDICWVSHMLVDLAIFAVGYHSTFLAQS